MARKRLQKVFALLLTASMAMSLMSVGAAADETGEEARGTIEIKVGQTQEITDYGVHDAESGQEESWHSSNEDVVIVDSADGTVTVTGVGEDTATITHTYYTAEIQAELMFADPADDSDQSLPDGEGSTSDGEGSTSDGEGSTSDGEGSTSDGEGSTSDGEGSTSDGEGSTSDGEGSTSDGEGSTSDGEGGTSDGEGSTSDGEGSTSDGEGSTPDGEGSTPDGEGSTPDGGEEPRYEQHVEYWEVVVTASEESGTDFGELTDSGEGWEWYEETATLVLTADTGDYPGSSSTRYPWQAYSADITSAYAEGIHMGKYVLNDLSNLTDVTFVDCEMSAGSVMGCEKLETATFRRCDLGVDCIRSADKLTQLTLEDCGDLEDYAFQNLKATNLNFTIINGGRIGGSAFYNVGFENVTITGGELGFAEDVYNNETYYYAVFDGAWWQPDATLTMNQVDMPSDLMGSFSWCDIPDHLVLNGCKVGYDAFSYANNLPTTLEMTDCEVGSQAFSLLTDGALESGDDRLKSVSITGGTIAQLAFCNNVGLTSLTLQDVEQIETAAFSGCSGLTEVIVKGDTYLSNAAFRGCTALERAVLDGEVELEQDVFASCPALKEIVITGTELRGILGSGSVPETAQLVVDFSKVTFIDDSYFRNCKALQGELDLSNVQYIGYHAFSGCTGITKLIVSDDAQLEYSDIFPNVIENWSDRVSAILDGKFQLEEADRIDAIAPDGWTSTRTGAYNSTVNYGDTQLTKEAKWADEDCTVADVQIKAYYSVPQQMDFVFVLDCTDSMSVIGNPDGDQYAKFYDMQSKLLDVSEELMTTAGYDCKVAFTGYGETDSFNSGWFTSADEAQDYIWGITDYKSLTNISLGLAEAQKLVEGNTGRNTAVILISDGTPHKGNQDFPSDMTYYGYDQAAAIKAAGADIYGVLHAITGGVITDKAEEVMTTICGEGNYFTAYDTEGFSQAINDAISVSYGEFVLTDTVDPAFTLDESTIQASCGEVEITTDSNGNTVLVWTIRGMPFMVHTLTFQETLNQVDNAYPTGDFDTNEGDAQLIPEGGDPVNAVETPVLPREDTQEPTDPGENPDPGDDDDDDDDDDRPENPGTDIPDEDTPTTDVPGTDIPDEDTPTTEIPEEDPPMAEAPKTGDFSALWLALTGLSGSGLAAVTFLGRKKRDEE